MIVQGPAQNNGPQLWVGHNCVGDWVEGDRPMEEHANLFPHCPFVRGVDVGNLPIGSEAGQSQVNKKRQS